MCGVLAKLKSKTHKNIVMIKAAILIIRISMFFVAMLTRILLNFKYKNLLKDPWSSGMTFPSQGKGRQFNSGRVHTDEMESTLKIAKGLVTPSKAEEKKVHAIISEVANKINKEAKLQKLSAKLQAGGSAAKGTWLPGLSDIDFFLLFDYDEFSEKSAEISSYTERILKNIFKINKLHGSRDYFSTNYKDYNIEIVPVLDISEEQEAKNITDFSPLHVNWFNALARKNPKLRTEARLAKQFFKVAGVYGAESYIRGLSGHAIEILIAYHGSFTNLVKAVAKWKFQEVIDIKRYYKSTKQVFEKLNKSKLNSAIILVDPIEKNRNAAAAFEKDKFMLAKEVCHKFLDKPSTEFFKEKEISIESLKKKKQDMRLIVVHAKAQKGKPDVVGAKLRKEFEQLGKTLAENDFVVQDSGWHIHGDAAMFWFYLDPTPLSAKKQHSGPPVKLKEFAKAFRKKWKSVKIKDGWLVAEIKRKYTTPEQLMKQLKINFKVY